jgi:hypothetical protein
MLTAREGGVITVALAVPVVADIVLDALMLTAYVPAGVPEGAPFAMLTLAVCPGLSVTEEVDRDVVHPAGSLDPRLIELDEHPEESLFVTVTE